MLNLLLQFASPTCKGDERRFRSAKKHWKEGKKCEAMDRISARRDEEAVIGDRYETAKLLWDNGEHDYEKISKIARLTLEQVREALSVQSV